MKIAALLAVAALAGSAAKSSTARLDAFVLLGNGRIVKLDVASGRVVVRRVLGSTPRVLPEHGDMLVVSGSRVYALVRTRRQTLAVESADASAGNSVIAPSRSTGRVLHRWRFPGYVVGVAGA